jgi:hypothetical protein
LSKQADIEDELYVAAAVRNGLVADDGQRQAWALLAQLAASAKS